ncbi:unnamed protein product [Phaedon cochleariae]|uniref:ER-bound oxygenase mpaB/mpaB'/Rubber oxygenase catalytic domain-containing protein n=1 Tax=Phaedon cochleariae TaxID=80249 RepID=A0A9P0GTA4_PHACE|nr:unnamed protein product [Phaedon cochleariae]
MTENFHCREINRKCTEFSAEKFVDVLLTEGEKATCDETSESFNEHCVIPTFYDEILCKKGQNCFHQNRFSFCLTSLLGLTALGTRPALKILILTKQQCTPIKAYRRYLATILYMLELYEYEFKPGSKSWSSLEKVRKMHNFASNLGHRKLDYRINQLEMALTQFGFIGFALVRGRFIGIHEVSEEELKGFIHLWRAVGYVLGIEDRFNICRESVKETKEICEELMRRVFIPGLQQPGDDFYNVAKVVVEGFRGMIPGLHLDNMLHYTHMIMESNEDVANCAKDHLSPLDTIEQLKLKILVNVMWAMQYRIFRFIMNNFLLLIIWLWINFPIVAYWKFGITHHSHVRI